jgi:hypothetical protein
LFNGIPDNTILCLMTSGAVIGSSTDAIVINNVEVQIIADAGATLGGGANDPNVFGPIGDTGGNGVLVQFSSDCVVPLVPQDNPNFFISPQSQAYNTPAEDPHSYVAPGDQQYPLIKSVQDFLNKLTSGGGGTGPTGPTGPPQSPDIYFVGANEQYQSITAALAVASPLASASSRATIAVVPGNYSTLETYPLTLTDGIDLVGCWDSTFPPIGTGNCSVFLNPSGNSTPLVIVTGEVSITNFAIICQAFDTIDINGASASLTLNSCYISNTSSINYSITNLTGLYLSLINSTVINTSSSQQAIDLSSSMTAIFQNSVVGNVTQTGGELTMNNCRVQSQSYQSGLVNLTNCGLTEGVILNATTCNLVSCTFSNATINNCVTINSGSTLNSSNTSYNSTVIGGASLIDGDGTGTYNTANDWISPTSDNMVIGTGMTINVLGPLGMSNGQILIGSSNGSSLATTITAGTGISVTNNPGSITISSGTSTYLFAGLTTGNQTISNATTTRIPMTSALVNDNFGGSPINGSGQIVIPNTGTYTITGTMYGYCLTADGPMQAISFGIFVNGTNNYVTDVIPGTTIAISGEYPTSANGNVMLPLSAGDTVDIRVTAFSPTSGNFIIYSCYGSYPTTFVFTTGIMIYQLF